jgi:hypothetical protein
MIQEPWNKTEDDIIMKANRKYGANFGWILEQQFQSKASIFGHFRSSRQIMSRYQELISDIDLGVTAEQNIAEADSAEIFGPNFRASELYRRSYEKRLSSIKDLTVQKIGATAGGGGSGGGAAGGGGDSEQAPSSFLMDEGASAALISLSPLQILEQMNEIGFQSEIMQSD